MTTDDDAIFFRSSWLGALYKPKQSLRGNFDHPDFPHGVRTGAQYGCNCELCRKADNAYKADWRYRREPLKPKRLGRPRKSQEIGTRNCYRRCRLRSAGAHPACAEANRQYYRDRRRNR